MLNKLGKELRKLRIDKGEIIRDMAQKLNMSASYLSSIEMGRRTIPKDIAEKVIAIYQLNNEAATGIRRAYDMSITEANIDLSHTHQERRELALSFARNFGSLTEEEIEKFKSILQRKDEK